MSNKASLQDSGIAERQPVANYTETFVDKRHSEWQRHLRAIEHFEPNWADLCFLFWLSFSDFETKFWFVVQSNPMRGKFQVVVFYSNICWNGILFPIPKLGDEYRQYVNVSHLLPNLKTFGQIPIDNLRNIRF